MKLFAFITVFALTSVASAVDSPQRAVIKNYCDIAYASYYDSLIAANFLKTAVKELIAKPTVKSLAGARKAWIKARIPYQQTEVFRFGNSIVDDWEGKVNAWPLDEGLIDYVNQKKYGTSDENPFYSANIIANPKLQVGGKVLDATKITPKVLQSLHELDGIESNVATGYHAIEFLLWGQDLNGTKAGAGNRPATDFNIKSCTGGNCQRRAAYLLAATELLITDLTEMVSQWAPKGLARQSLLKGKEGIALKAMLTGMGSLSYGELAGERMKLGLMLHDPEEEHDCFSDNTHDSHYYDVKGIQNVYLGQYQSPGGNSVDGPGLNQLVASQSKSLDQQMQKDIQNSLTKMAAIRAKANAGVAYDMLIARGNKAGNKIIMDAVNALTTQTKTIEKVVTALKLDNVEFEGSDSLDQPEKVKVN